MKIRLFPIIESDIDIENRINDKFNDFYRKTKPTKGPLPSNAQLVVSELTDYFMKEGYYVDGGFVSCYDCNPEVVKDIEKKYKHKVPHKKFRITITIGED